MEASNQKRILKDPFTHDIFDIQMCVKITRLELSWGMSLITIPTWMEE